MSEVAVLMSVHNRREQTLRSLGQLSLQADAFRGEGRYSFSFRVVDDGCTDGTREAVSEAFPEVKIIPGDGTLYWNRGLRLAWQDAASSAPDFYLWVKTGIELEEGALATLLETSEFFGGKAIVAGTCASSSGEVTHGGLSKGGKLINPDPTIPLPCHTFSGNLVLVPNAVYVRLGMLDERYHNAFGDFDYGVRAFKAGIPRVVAPGILARCERPAGPPPWRDSGYSLSERWRYFIGPKGRPPREQFLYDCRSKGLPSAIGHAISLGFKVIFPKRAK